MLCNVIGIGNAACQNTRVIPLNSTTPVPPADPSGSDSLARQLHHEFYLQAVSGLVNETGVMN